MILLLTLPSVAQLRTSKPKKGPRAIAVVRWQTSGQGKALPRLLPVLIVEEGKYYDANLFRAAPRPMALEPGVVYEAQDKGDVLGYFTVKSARAAVPRQWYGLGEFQPVAGSAAPELRDRTQTAEVVKESKPGEGKDTSPIFTESVDDRDIKKKSTVYDEEGREIPEGRDTDDKPPTLKRKEGDIDRSPQVAPPKKEAPKVPTADEDPERPRLKRGTAGDTGAASTTASTNAPTSNAEKAPQQPTTARRSADDDPNRPVLRRGGSGQQKTGTSEMEQSPGGPVPARVQARGDVPPAMRPAAGFALRTFEAVAVSDAEDVASEAVRRDFRFRWSNSEREELAAKMRRIAEDEVTKTLRATGRMPQAPTATKAGTAKKATPSASSPALTDAQLSGLDLDANNSAELVYSGRATLTGGQTVFVTVVARTDVNGNPRKLFSAVATSDRLDVSPRLELVDAVDADGDRRGELLFRRIRDTGAEFVVYRVAVDTLIELFHGGNAE